MVCRWTKLRNVVEPDCGFKGPPAERIWADDLDLDSEVERPAVGMLNESSTFGNFFFDSADMNPKRSGDIQHVHEPSGKVAFVDYQQGDDEVYVVDKIGNFLWSSKATNGQGGVGQIEAIFVTPSGKIGVLIEDEGVRYLDVDTGDSLEFVTKNNFVLDTEKRVINSEDQIWEQFGFSEGIHLLDPSGNELFSISSDDDMADGLAIDDTDTVYATIDSKPPVVRKIDSSGAKGDVTLHTPEGYLDVDDLNFNPAIGIDPAYNIVASYDDVNNDERVLKIDQEGNVIWVADMVWNQISGIKCDGVGHTFVRGPFEWPDGKEYDSIAKFDTEGNRLWFRSVVPEDEDSGFANGSDLNPLIVWPGPFGDG